MNETTDLVKSDYSIMDSADEQQIISSNDDLKHALVYDLKGTKQITYIGLKYLVLKMSQSNQALHILKSEVTLDKDDPENKPMWYWRSIVRVRNHLTGLETEGISEAPYFENGKYDKFGRTKAISKAERNAWRKQIPELEIITLLKNVDGERTQKIESGSSSAKALNKICTCENPHIGIASGKCLKCGGKQELTTIEENNEIDSEYYCTCENSIHNSITNGKTCLTCNKLTRSKK